MSIAVNKLSLKKVGADRPSTPGQMNSTGFEWIVIVSWAITCDISHIIHPWKLVKGTSLKLDSN